jgi:hypothetical protein
MARGEAVNVRQAYRDGGVGRTHAEVISYAAALADLEDAKRTARWRQQMRRAGLDPDTGGELEQPQPPEIVVEIGAGEDLEAG